MMVRVVLLLLGLISGVALAAAAFYGVFGPSQPQQQPAAVAAPVAPPPPQTMVVVAARAIPTGTLITAPDLRFAPPAGGNVTAADYVRVTAPSPKEQQAADRRVFGEVIGGVSRIRFDEGDAVVRGQTVKPGDAGFLAAVLRPGMHAITMSVNIVTGNNALLTPGDHVDAVLTQVFPGHETDPANRAAAETIASDLRVIAVDQRLQAGAEPQQKEARPAQTVTLEVTALQAEKVDVAAKMGELALATRGVLADAVPGTQPGDQNPAKQAPPPPVFSKDVSQAAATVQPPKAAVAAGGKNAPGAAGAAASGDQGGVRVMHGEKLERVVVP